MLRIMKNIIYIFGRTIMKSLPRIRAQDEIPEELLCQKKKTLSSV